MTATDIFQTWEPDPVGEILGTGYYRYATAEGVHGLAKITGEKLEILAVVVDEPGQGRFREFIAAVKDAFKVVEVWHIWSPVVVLALYRYGFKFLPPEVAGEPPCVRWVAPEAAP